jgi:hypothetical protein
MKKSTLFIILSLLVFCFSCEKLSGNFNSKPSFKIYNKSKDKLTWIRIFVKDDLQENRFELIQIFNGIMNENSVIPKFKIDLKKYSRTGQGGFYLQALKEGSTDTINANFGGFNKYNFYDNSFPGYNTYEIIILDKLVLPPPNQNLESKISFAKYKDENKIEGYPN